MPIPTMPIALDDITIHPIVEQEGAFFDVMGFFPELEQERSSTRTGPGCSRTLSRRRAACNLCIQSFVIKTPHHNILVDACVGNHKPRPTRPFWNMLNSDRFEKELAAVGLTVNDIDYVMCTHLHTDHVGWNTKLENGRWVPTFPEGAIHHVRPRACALDAAREGQSVERAVDHRLGAADRRSQARADRQKRFRLQRADPVHSDAGTHHRSFLGSGRQHRQRLPDHRRHDPFAAARQISAIRHDVGLRFPAGRDRRGIRCSTASARARRSCARRIFRRLRPGGCGAGATATNSCRCTSDAASRVLCYQNS